MKQCKFKFALACLVTYCIYAVNSFAAQVEPFFFQSVDDNPIQQQDEWDLLIKYKLFGTGVNQGDGSYKGIYFNGQQIYITDTVGYVGSALGDLNMSGNIRHSLGGPILFGGSFIDGDGEDTLMTGPIRFKGDFTVSFNAREKNIFRGNICILGNANDYALNDMRKEGNILTSSECVSDEYVPNVDEKLQIPIIRNPSATYLPPIVASNGNAYIDVPPYTGEGSKVYDIYIESISFNNSGSLYIRMPVNGRLTRIFLKNTITGLGSTSGTNIQVLHAFGGGEFNNVDLPADTWDGVSWNFDETKPQNVISNLDYAGNLLFYTPTTISMGAGQKNLQGTYIMGEDLTIQQNTTFAGQFLARSIQINAEFKAKDFRYVPFDPPALKVDNNKKLYEDHEIEGDTVKLFLNDKPPTNVPFRYCFEFPDKSADASSTKYAHRTDVVDESIPICSEGDTVRTMFLKGNTTLTSPIILHAKYDALVENTERFYIRICDLEAAVYADGDRSSACSRLPIDIVNVPRNPLGKDFFVTGFMNDPLVISEFPAMLPDSTALADYSVRIDEIPSVVGSLSFKGIPVTVGTIIDSKELAQLTYKGKLDEFGAPYDSLRYSIVRNSDNTVSDDSYKLIINLVSVMFSVYENSLASTLVGQILTDIINPTFRLLDTSNTFAIDSKTGVITVLADSTINFEKKDLYFVDVIIENSNTSKTISVQISAIDVNDPPIIKDTVMSIYENEPIGTGVGVLSFFDEDGINTPFRNNTFSLIGGDSSLFTIDSISGAISSKKSFDYESLPIDKKYYTIQVQITDSDNYKSIASVQVNILNRIENSVIVVTHAQSGTLDYSESNPSSLIKINDKTLTLTWTGDNIKQPDTTLKNLHEGYNSIVLNYFDKTKDSAATKKVDVFVSTKTPEVNVSTEVNEVIAFNIFTYVEPILEGDTSFYVNKKNNDISVSVKTPILDSTYTDSTCNYTTKEIKISAVILDTIKISKNITDTFNSIANEKLMLNDMPTSKVIHTPYNDSLYMISYTEKVGTDSVKVSYITNDKGDVLNNQIIVSYQTKIDGNLVALSYKADAFTGELKKSSLKGDFLVSYEFTDKNNNIVSVSYEMNFDGKVVKDSENNVGYEVSYTYINEFGNSAKQSIYIVVDVTIPKVSILSPHTDDVLFSNYIDVEWTVDKNDGKGPVVMDTLKVQGLSKGANTIVRYYRDKAGNSASDTVYVIMKDAKDVDISVVTPVTLVTQKKRDEYYSVNEPEKGETFAISIYNTKSGREVETLVGGEFKTKEGSGDEPYPKLEGHLGPTLAVDAKLPAVSAVSGLATLDDLVGSDGLISLDGVEALKGEKSSVDDYVSNHCSSEFQAKMESDISRMSLYNTVMYVKIWVYTTLGNFVDYFTFEHELDNPDYVNEAGVLTLYFEQKPDKDGYVKTENGKLYATGAYIYKTEVTLKSILHCDLPPLKSGDSANKMGAIKKVSEDLLKPFGYKRPEYK